MKNILLTIEYDGAGFSGWQRQPGKRTVQGELERVLSLLCGQEILIDGTGRTDAGVHALGQCATFSAEFGIPVERIMPAANDLLTKNRMMGSDVRITSVRQVRPEFHARFSAVGKKYVYRIFNGPQMPVFLRNYRYHVKQRLDVDAMRRALAAFPGTHDFAGFMAAGSNLKGGTVRKIFRTELETADVVSRWGTERVSKSQPLLQTEAEGQAGETADKKLENTGIQGQTAGMSTRIISAGPNFHSAFRLDSEEESDSECSECREISVSLEGNGFLYNMVRIIAGTLVDVGLGRISAESLPEILDSCDRSRAGHTAPPQGLYMAEVYFRENDI